MLIRRKLGLLATSSLASVLALSAAAQSRAPAFLAKAGVAQATAAAAQWRPDAALVQVAGSNVRDDGTQRFWKYGFYSPSAQTCLIVQLGPVSRTTQTGGPLCESPQLGDFMDSDRAIQIARNSGMVRPDITMVVSMVPTSRGSRAVWIVMEGTGLRPGERSMDIDAQTGEVLKSPRA